MDFIEVTFVCDQPLKEILLAELSELNFESFLEEANSLRGYVQADQYCKDDVKRLHEKYGLEIPLSSKVIPPENWNQVWEQQYEPVTIDGKCRISASFHQLDPKYPFELVINPQMSFGTGHHETTELMISRQLCIDHQGKSVLDLGCGTGILSILAEKMGAKNVWAIDIDRQATENTNENVELNLCKRIEIYSGTMGTWTEIHSSKSFELILANINRNAILEEIESYTQSLSPQGHVLLSGFYTQDVEKIVDKGKAFGLHLLDQSTYNNWASLFFGKELA